MITIDSPNIFWTRIKEKQPDVIFQTIYHEEPNSANFENRKLRIMYPPYQRGKNTSYFFDKSSKWSMEGWWLH